MAGRDRVAQSYFDHPIAVLVGRDGHERLVAVSDPPPHVYEVPIPQRLSIVEATTPPQYEAIKRRVFRLSRFRTRSPRWMRVYNEGRSQTPEDAYVYLEDA